MSQNNTISGSARRNSSPELWIPYVLIGVSCVTFLAVHFWCYHKRNRERYLRKRDETRVKSGLLERRRITTLMLAKYQSDLGIIPKEKPVDLTRLFYDNSVDVIFDEYDYYRNISSNKHRAIHSSTSVSRNREPALPLSQAPTNTEGIATATTSIANSQTWPLVTERKNTPYNAHRRSSKDDSTKESAAGTRSIDEYDNENVIYTPTTKDKQKSQIMSGVLMPNGGSITDSVNKAQKLSSLQIGSEQDSTGQANVLRISSPPTSYPRIFYTSLASSNSAQSSFFSVFTPKHRKRRCYSSPAEDSSSDQFGITENIVNKPGEFSRLYATDAACSVQDSIYINSEGVVLENREKPFYRQVESTAQGFFVEEALPFAEGGLEYGSIGHNSESEQAQMIPFYDDSCHNLQDIGDQSVMKNCYFTNQENPVYCLQSSNMDNVNFRANSDVESATGSSIGNTGSPHNCLYQQNVIIPFPEKSYLNIVSKNPGKTRANARGNDPPHVSLSRPRPGKVTKRNTIDSYSNIPKLQASNSRSHDPRLHQESLTLLHLSETPGSQNTTSGLSFGKDVPENTESCVDYVSGSELNTPNNNDSLNTTQGKPAVCNTIPKTPTLRSLDKCIVFQNTKRKLGVNTE